MSHIGMYQPQQKDGKNWIVKYSITLNGVVKENSRKFRVRADAQNFVTNAKSTVSRDDRVTASSFKISKFTEVTS